MATPTFYHPELSLRDTLLELSSSEASHAAKSRRLKEGQAVQLINGRGFVAHGQIVASPARSISVQVVSINQADKPAHKLCIATAIPKGDRQRAMIEMLTQIGVERIIPLNCEHSVTRYKASMQPRWQRWAIEACKQSHNPWLPDITEGLTLEQLFGRYPQQLAYADSAGSSVSALRAELRDPVVLIGPEGGFSCAELASFSAEEVKPFNLPGHILRTETASVTAASLWSAGG